VVFRSAEWGEQGGAGEDGADAGPDRADGEVGGFEAGPGGGTGGEVPVELSGEPGGLGVVEASGPADDARDGGREPPCDVRGVAEPEDGQVRAMRCCATCAEALLPRRSRSCRR
jgi:hypothetical protein